MNLFDADDSGPSIRVDIRSRPEESLNHLSINKEFAERYLHNQQRAELHQLEAKYGREADDDDEQDDTDSEDDVTEDEDGDQVNASVDAAIFRTLKRIRNKDAALYNPDIDIFELESAAAQEAARSNGARPTKDSSKKSKKVTLQDYQRQRVQELMHSSADPAKELASITTVTSDRNRYDDADQPLPPALEQDALRKEVSQAFHAGFDDADDLFVKRQPQSHDSATSYRNKVLASLGPDADEETIREALRDYNADQVVKQDKTDRTADEDFLLDYILNRGWIDQQEVAGPSKPKLPRDKLPKSQTASIEDDGQGHLSSSAYGRDWEAEAAELESDDSFDSMADAFESAYNFRFEQGEEANTIPTYSRNLKNTARRQDTTRKRKREERLERKEQEKHQKMQEMSRLRNLKRTEIVDKLRRLREVTGFKPEDLEDLDLEKDFDPQEHDRTMAQVFGDTYYKEEDHDFDETEKPAWDEDIEIDDILAEADEMDPKKKKKPKKSNEMDDDRIEMDADFMGDAAPTTPGSVGKEASIRALLADKKLSKKERKKLKKKLKAATDKSRKGGEAMHGEEEEEEDEEDEAGATMPETVAKVRVEQKQKAKDIVDEYYNLDYEDMIGDQPTRFKYAQVAPADYGMSAVDILLADDLQLNNVVGLKNLQPYRKGKTRPIDLGRRLGEFRREVYGQEKNAASRQGADGDPGSTKKRLGKKERQRLKQAESASVEQ